jgi:hypothetical protein
VRRRRALLALLVIGAATASTVIVVALATRSSERTPPLPSRGISASAALVPRQAFFGDTVLARLTILLDRRRIDPTTLTVGGNFSPYGSATEPQRTMREIGHATKATYTFRLTCLNESCLPPDPIARGRFTVALGSIRVGFDRQDGKPGTLAVALPPLEVASRLAPTDIAAGLQAQVPPFRVSTTPPRVHYSVSPTLLEVLLFGGAGLLLTAAGWLAWRFAPRRSRERPLLPRIERALVILDDAHARGAVADRRKALELLANELRYSGKGSLASSAELLAWSEQPPRTPAKNALSDRVRETIENGPDGAGT